MTQLRAITIESLTPAQRIQWSVATVIPNGVERRWRKGDTLFVERTQASQDPQAQHQFSYVDCYEVPAVIQFRDILAKCEAREDSYADTPWANDDGLAHDLLTGDKAAAIIASVEQQGGHTRDVAGRVCVDSETCFITIPERIWCEWGIEAYHRSRGCSKQVAAELRAQAVQKTIRELVEFYQSYCSYYATGNFEDPTGKEHKESLHGFYTEDDAADYGCEEVAGEIACDLEADGFIVRRPRVNKRALKKRDFKNKLQTNIHLFDLH